jgi:glc operon protein GlcG
VRTLPQLELADARRIAAAARAHAEAEGWAVVIAIVDEGGHLMFLERADATQKGSVRVAQEKARTALLFKRPTKALEDAIASGKLQMLDLPGATPIEGGLPLLVDGHPVGAIGVSGVLSSQDGLIAAAGVAAL